MANEAALDQALARYRRYLEASPDGRFAENVMVEMELRFPLTKRDHELFAAAYYARGHYAKALEEWRKAGNTSQWYKQGVAQIRTGNATAGKATLLNGIRNHPNDDSVEEAATMLARMSNSQGAVDVWNLVAQRSSRFADVALWNLGIRAATHPASLGYYRQILSKYPTSRYAPESAWWLVWEEIKNGRGSAVVPQLHTYAARYADARAGTRFAYWAGKVYEKQGKKPQALAAYQQTINIRPWDYYAYRAQNRMAALNGGRDEGWRTDPTRRVSWLQDSSANWDWPEPPQELAQQHGTTIATLNELRQWDECIELVPKDAGALRGFYMAKMDMPLQAINAAVPDLKGKPQRSEIWELAYPLVYAKQIAREGPRVRVDPLLVQALIREESRYNPAAVSSSNALGLMQLLPGTAYGVAKRLGIKLNSHADIHQPATNIALGTDYLGYVHRRHNDNSLFAVASYNGGPNAVARWVKTMPTDTDVFVENIPYRETRDYVRKVFGSYWNYRAIYGS
jgi:soluble lytic murein transglycosylase